MLTKPFFNKTQALKIAITLEALVVFVGSGLLLSEISTATGYNWQKFFGFNNVSQAEEVFPEDSSGELVVNQPDSQPTNDSSPPVVQPAPDPDPDPTPDPISEPESDPDPTTPPPANPSSPAQTPSIPTTTSSQPPVSTPPPANPPTTPAPPITPPEIGVACGLKDTKIHEIPDIITIPKLGESYIDPVFGCSITRLSDAGAEGQSRIVHQYSSVNPFNSNSTYVLTFKNGVAQVRNLRGNIIRDNLPIGDLSNPFWSRSDPNLIYYHTRNGNQLKTYKVSTGESRTIYTFDQYDKVSFGMGEGDISFDGDHLPVLGDDRFAFIHQISTGENSLTVDLAAYSDVDNIDVTPAGYLTLISRNPKGTELWSNEMDYLGKILDYKGHSDRGRDTDGTDILVITNSNDSTPISSCQNGIVKKRLPDGAESCLLQPLSWSIAVHVSCNNVGRGWCAVSTYSESKNPTNTFQNEIIKVNLNGGFTRLAHTRSSNNGYYGEPRAAVDSSGKFVVFDSDMGTGGPTDVYLITLP